MTNPPLLDCRAFSNPNIQRIASSWIGFIDQSGSPHPRRPLFMRILWLSDGRSFTCKDIKKMIEQCDELDGKKPEVIAVREWLNRCIKGVML